jgi:hypothetical protein
MSFRGEEVSLGEDLGGDGGVEGGWMWDACAEAPMVEEGGRRGARGGVLSHQNVTVWISTDIQL